MIAQPDSEAWWVMVHLTFDPQQVAVFHLYETNALQLVHKHGGQLQLAFRPHGREDSEEVHLLRFPDQASFEVFREDPARAKLQSMAIQAGISAQIWMGDQEIAYPES